MHQIYFQLELCPGPAGGAHDIPPDLLLAGKRVQGGYPSTPLVSRSRRAVEQCPDLLS